MAVVKALKDIVGGRAEIPATDQIACDASAMTVIPTGGTQQSVPAAIAGRVLADANGRVSASKLGVSLTNLAFNADFAQGVGNVSPPSGTSLGSGVTSLVTLETALTPAGVTGVKCTASGTSTAGSFYYFRALKLSPSGGLSYIPVLAGQTYEYSIYLSASASAGIVQAQILWYKADGSFLGNSAGTYQTSGYSAGGTALSTYFRSVVIAQAPVNAAFGEPIYQFNSPSGTTNGYIVASLPMFALAQSGQTEASPYVDPAVSVSTGANLLAKSVPSSALANITETGGSTAKSIEDALAGKIGALSALTAYGVATTPTGLAARTYALAQADDAPNLTYPTCQFSHAPVASEYITRSALYSHTVTDPSVDQRIFAYCFMFESASGGSHAVGDLAGERVALYTGMRGKSGSGSIWARNTCVHLASGYTGVGACGDEIDITNSAQHRGEGYGQFSYTAVNSIGIGVNSYGDYRNAAAFWVDGSLTGGGTDKATGGAWNRGYGVAAGSINSATGTAFVDYSNADASFASWGSHRLAMDCTHGTYSLGVIGAKLGTGLVWFDTDASIPVSVIPSSTGLLTLTARGIGLSGTNYQTSATAGGATAPPATPALYYPIYAAGAWRLMPLYNPPSGFTAPA